MVKGPRQSVNLVKTYKRLFVLPYKISPICSKLGVSSLKTKLET